MSRLSNPKATRTVVSRYDFDFHKGLGQNFLTDEGVILRALKAADVTENDVVFEIGPGIGTLTQYLCDTAYRVIAVEVDSSLIPILEETLTGYDNVTVINQDVMKTDLTALAKECRAGRKVSGPAGSDNDERAEETSDTTAHPLKIVANLPYYITTPILMSIFKQNVPAESVTVMVQKEVADRMTAEPGKKEYGSLSLAVQYYSKARIVEIVPPSSFMPRPKVTSAVVTMDLYDRKPVESSDDELLFSIIRAAFEMRRKTLVNALGSNVHIPYGKDQVRDALETMGKSPAVRGETLSLREFANLADILKDKKPAG